MDPCGEAAHVRLGTHAGLGRKPPAAATVPLCHDCHMKQHSIGELSFWAELQIAPLLTARRLFKLSPNLKAMRALCSIANSIDEVGE